MTGEGGPKSSFGAFALRARAAGNVPREVLAAFEATPRAAFLSGQHHPIAWSDRMIPIECGEAIEGVDLQAKVIASLALEPGSRVLEIGTGSGYTAAVMSRLAARVVTVDRYKTLVELARQRFEMLGIANAFVRQADGSAGLAGEGPFDRIVVWAAFDSLPRAFVDQLATTGIMITPIGPEEGRQSLSRLSKIGSRFEREDIETVRFLPIAKGLAAKL